MKAAEVRVLEADELDGRLKTSRRELYELRFKIAVGQLDDHRQIRRVRQDIARLLTFRRQRELGLIPASGGAAAPEPPKASETAKALEHGSATETAPVKVAGKAAGRAPSRSRTGAQIRAKAVAKAGAKAAKAGLRVGVNAKGRPAKTRVKTKPAAAATAGRTAAPPSTGARKAAKPVNVKAGQAKVKAKAKAKGKKAPASEDKE